MKSCSCCEATKPLDEFGKDRNSKDGLRSRCKTCVREDNKRYYHANREKRRQATLQWIKDNPEKYKAGNRRRNRRATERVKREVVDAYGGACSCCGEADIHFLTLDHIEGRGPEDVQKGEKMYRLAKKQGFPDCYRVLCHNCNSAYGHYGFCPHSGQRRYR